MGHMKNDLREERLVAAVCVIQRSPSVAQFVPKQPGRQRAWIPSQQGKCMRFLLSIGLSYQALLTCCIGPTRPSSWGQWFPAVATDEV